MTRVKVASTGLFCSGLITLICALMAIYTGNYSLSEKWGWSGFTFSCFCAVQALLQGALWGNA